MQMNSLENLVAKQISAEDVKNEIFQKLFPYIHHPVTPVLCPITCTCLNHIF